MSADDNRRDEYLWDPAAPPDAEVEALEKRLAPARFDARRHPLRLPSVRPRSAWGVRAAVALAAAAVAVIAVGLWAFLSWRLVWTPGAAWAAEIRNSSDQSAVRTALALDRPLTLSGTSSARVDIARIGTMRVSPGSALTLSETTATRHRVFLDRGSVSVRLWAPPGMFAFRTPSGVVRDLGCIFDLNVDTEGTARLRVDTGWVQMDNDFGESLVPAGATAEMRRLARPGVPIYADASDVFATAVRAAQTGGDPSARRELDTIVRTARRRDVLTLLDLARVSPPDVRRPLLVRAAELRPPPSAVSFDAVAAGDRSEFWKWRNSLDLPPLKSWWRNWRDALPWR